MSFAFEPFDPLEIDLRLLWPVHHRSVRQSSRSIFTGDSIVLRRPDRLMPLTGCGGEGPDDVVEAAVRDLYAGRGEEFILTLRLSAQTA